MNSIDVASEPELFAVACPRCAAALAVSDDLAGIAAGCPICRTTFLVPEPELPPSPPPQPSTGADRATATADPVWHDIAPALADAVATPIEQHRDMEFREPANTLETDDGTVQLRRLSDEEKRFRRSRRNVVMLLAGTVILIALTALLGRTPNKKTR